MADQPLLAHLVEAVFDVMPSERTELLPIANASPDHRARFQTYVRDLSEAKKGAEKWWTDLIAAEIARVGDRRHAEINVRTRRPSGPVVDPAVINVIRSAWLDCQTLNDRVGDALRLAPVALVGMWLEESGYRDLVAFVAPLHFWPVALNDSNRWE